MNVKDCGAIGFVVVSIVQAALVVLKLTGDFPYSWWCVFAPAACVAAAIVIGALAALVAEALS